MQDGAVLGFYVADTGNDCVRFINHEGNITTPALHNIPDVRETASDCVGGQCVPEFWLFDIRELIHLKLP